MNCKRMMNTSVLTRIGSGSVLDFASQHKGNKTSVRFARISGRQAVFRVAFLARTYTPTPPLSSLSWPFERSEKSGEKAERKKLECALLTRGHHSVFCSPWKRASRASLFLVFPSGLARMASLRFAAFSKDADTWRSEMAAIRVFFLFQFGFHARETNY